MANTIQIKFGNLLMQAGDITIGPITEKINRTVKLSSRILAHGSIPGMGIISSKEFSFDFSVIGRSYADLRANRDIVKAAFFNGVQQFTQDDDRFILAQNNGFEWTDRSMHTHARGKASFIAHYPFWLSLVLHEDSRTPTSGTGYLIINNGNADTPLKIEITAPAGGITDNIQIQNTSIGQICRYRGNVDEGNTVVIDNCVSSDEQDTTNSGLSDIAHHEGDWLRLKPGSNAIVFIGTAGSLVKLSWRDCWY